MLPRVAALVLMLLAASTSHAGTYYVAPDGSDEKGDGSTARPWATIKHATASVPDDGSTVLARDGLYTGAIVLERQFATGCVVRAEHPYRARFRSAPDSNRAFFCYGGSNVTFEGIEVFGSGGTKGDYVVHVAKPETHHITFRDCIIHDSYNDDLIKVNDLAHHVAFRGCLVYNARDAGGIQLFDINVVADVAVEDCILTSDQEGSGRATAHKAGSFIVIKNSSKDPANAAKTRRIDVRRNVFCNWEGESDQSYVLIGEDAKDFWEAQDVAVENNLFLFNTAVPSTGAVTCKCHVRNVTVRANTVLGTVLGWTCYAIRLSEERPKLGMEDIFIFNNIFDDPAGRMSQLIWGHREFVRGAELRNNLYWNAGKAFEHHESTLFRIPADDPAAVTADPRLPNPEKMVIPRWDAARGRFASGETSIRGEFERLVKLYGQLPAGSPAAGRADAKHMPPDDILGRPRGEHPDIGAWQTVPAVAAHP